MTTTAEKLLWDVERADAESPGCSAHLDPACLCDVDLSKTAGIEWNKMPPDLIDVDTVDDLVDTVAEMLIRHDIQNYVGETDNPKWTYDLVTISQDEALGEALDLLVNTDLPLAEVAERAGAYPNGVKALSAIFYCRSGGRPRNQVHDAVLELARQGLPQVEIERCLRERGIAIRRDNIYKILSRAGIQPGDYNAWKRRQEWPRLRELRERGLTPHQMYRETGIDHRRVRQILAEMDEHDRNAAA